MTDKREADVMAERERIWGPVRAPLPGESVEDYARRVIEAHDRVEAMNKRVAALFPCSRPGMP